MQAFVVRFGCEDYVETELCVLFWLEGLCGADLCGLSWLSLRMEALCLFGLEGLCVAKLFWFVLVVRITVTIHLELAHIYSHYI